MSQITRIRTKAIGARAGANCLRRLTRIEYVDSFTSTPQKAISYTKDAGLLLDLLGYLPGQQVRSELRSALKFQDPKLKHFAITSLLRQGEKVDNAEIEKVASSPEIRNWLYRILAKLGQSFLFPEKYRTQQAFSESEMVTWLIILQTVLLQKCLVAEARCLSFH
jgi:hypothetical protein